MIEWIGTVFLLAGVSLVTAGIPRYMMLACALGFIGDVILVIFFVLNFNLAMIVLNVVFALLSIVGIYRWRNKK